MQIRNYGKYAAKYGKRADLNKIDRHLAGFYVEGSQGGDILRRLEVAVENVQHLLPPVPELGSLEVGEGGRRPAGGQAANLLGGGQAATTLNARDRTETQQKIILLTKK